MVKKQTYYQIILLFILTTIFLPGTGFSQQSFTVKENYTKAEYRIPMRDGKLLYTVVYSPRDTTQTYPLLIWRTPYSCAPYGPGKYRSLPKELAKEKFIFVFQDVRGRFMSQGKFVNMRPYIPHKKGKQIDESSDAFDTVDWLIKNIKNNNGKAGMYGISYPGFYAAMACIDAHPALKAVSPQAPIANWFIDDDMHHHGALSLQMFFDFFSVFGVKRDSLTTRWPPRPAYPSPDAYTFFRRLEPLSQIDKKYFHKKIAFWEKVKAHPNYDEFWKKRNTLPHFKNIKPVVMVVGGWYDSEDLYGTIHTFQSIYNKNPGATNYFVMGPWPHGWWARFNGDRLGDLSFGSHTGEYFRKQIQLPFFKYYLKGKGNFNQERARMFNTGSLHWYSFQQWPPQNAKKEKLFLAADESLAFHPPSSKKVQYDEYIANPLKPVPYTAKFIDSRQMYYRPYMNEDQRFAYTRPDVLVFQTKPLQHGITLAGPLLADLYVSTGGTDADWVVKIIDVYPDNAPNPRPNPTHVEMGGYQALVRADILRGKYRNNLTHPQPFIPGKVTEIKLPLQDVFHTFKKGHRIMVQIQSSWFPFFDSNPQTFTDIYNATKRDFKNAVQRVYFSKPYPSNIQFNTLKQTKK